MTMDLNLRSGLLITCLLGLTACGGGGGSDSGGAVGNRAPVVDAGAAQTVDEFAAVSLVGTATDADGDMLTYTWDQTDGPVVTINNASSASASFDAPDVLAVNSPEVLTFRLTASDGSTTGSDTVDINISDVGLGANSPPNADAGANSNVAELTNVVLDGTGSDDADGDGLTYSWVQTSGPAVAIVNADMAQASFTAPDVAPGTTVALTFELTVSDGTDSDIDGVAINAYEALSIITVGGRLTYERPQRRFACNGYDFNSVTLQPVRYATVRLLDSANNELDRVRTDGDGNYLFQDVPANTEVSVLVRAESLQLTGDQTWELYVRDNTSNTAEPYEDRPIYAVRWDPYQTGVVHVTDLDLTAPTGWGTSSYDDVRPAASLAILDSLLDGVLLVNSVDSTVDFGRLDAFWSVNNSFTGGDDPDNGELVTAYYIANPDYPNDLTRNPSLFLRGDAVGRFPESEINTDEFDEYVILHEWGHFFEDQLSRSDSRGGYHELPGVVDALVAFGEGWGHAMGAMGPNNPVGCDTGHPATSGSDLDVENWDSRSGEQGFFNEMSVATFLWDLFDTANDGTDDDSIGFGPIYETMIDAQKNTASRTTLFSFAVGLRDEVDPSDLAFVDSQLARENVDLPVDEWASTQTTAPTQWQNGRAVRDLLPLYTELVPGGATRNLCVNDDTNEDMSHQDPGKWQYLYFTLGSSQDLTLTVQANPLPPDLNPPAGERDRSDPDVFLFRNGIFLGAGRSGDADREVFNTGTLTQGTYAIDFQDWRYEDDDTPDDPDHIAAGYPSRVCFDFTLN